MEQLIKEIISFIKDNSVRGISKLLIVIAIIISLLIIDNLSGFSYYNNLDNKLEELTKVSKLLENKSLDDKTKMYLLDIQNEILTRKNLKEKVYDIWSKISFTSSNDKIANELNSSTKVRNSTVEFITLNWFFLFLFLFLPLYYIIKPLHHKSWKNILIIIGVEIFLASLMFGLFLLFSLIPTIKNKPIYNYILNAVVVVVCLTINTIRLNRKTKTTANSGLPQ